MASKIHKSPTVSVESRAQYESVLNSEPVVVTKFSAPWCRVCKKMKSSYEGISYLKMWSTQSFVEFSKELAVSATFFEFDTTKLEELSMSLGVKGLPYFTVHVAGEKVGEFNGSKWPSIEEKLRHLIPGAAVSTLVRF